MGHCPPECRINPSERSLYGPYKTTTTQAWELRSRSWKGPLAFILNVPLGQSVLSVPTALGSAKETHSWQRIEQKFYWAMDASWMFGLTVSRTSSEEELLLRHVSRSDKLTLAGRGKAAFLAGDVWDHCRAQMIHWGASQYFLAPMVTAKDLCSFFTPYKGMITESQNLWPKVLFTTPFSVHQSLQIRIWSSIMAWGFWLNPVLSSLSFIGFPP